MIGRGNENIVFITPNWGHAAPYWFCENTWWDLGRTEDETRIKKPHW